MPSPCTCPGRASRLNSHDPLVPVEQRNTQADVSGVVVVVDHALAVALEHFGIAAQVAGHREAPAEAGRAVAAAAAAHGVAQQHAEFLTVPFMHDRHLAPTHVVADVGVVVVAGCLGNAPPRTHHHGPAIALEADVRDDPVPTARQGIAAAIGLV